MHGFLMGIHISNVFFAFVKPGAPMVGEETSAMTKENLPFGRNVVSLDDRT